VSPDVPRSPGKQGGQAKYRRSGPIAVLASASESFITPIIRPFLGEFVSHAHDDAGSPTLIRRAPPRIPFGTPERRDMLQLTDRARVRVGNKSVRRIPKLLIGLTIGVSALLVLRWSLASGPSVMRFWWSAALTGVAYSFIWATVLGARTFRIPGSPLHGDDDAIIRAWLAEGRCPACLYDLKSLTPEPPEPNDPHEHSRVALTRCPECSHAWRVPSGLNDAI